MYNNTSHPVNIKSLNKLIEEACSIYLCILLLQHRNLTKALTQNKTIISTDIEMKFGIDKHRNTASQTKQNKWQKCELETLENIQAKHLLWLT